MKKLSEILLKMIADKDIAFKIDSDKDGKPLVQGKINIAEVIDEAQKWGKE